MKVGVWRELKDRRVDRGLEIKTRI